MNGEEHSIMRKNLPIAMVVFLLLQSGAGVWWASNIDTRVARMESEAASVSEARLVRLEERMVYMTKQIGRLEEILATLAQIDPAAGQEPEREGG